MKKKYIIVGIIIISYLFIGLHLLELYQETTYIVISKNFIGSNEFNDRNDLRSWLLNNSVDKNQYIKIFYDCDNIAFDLYLDAYKDGYKMGIVYFNKHAWCITSISGEIYIIDPSHDWTYDTTEI